MYEKERERVMELYGCNENITSYLISTGTKIGTTSKAKLKQGIVDELEDDD